MEENYFFSKWPNWVRYILTVPLAILGSILAVIFVPWISTFYIDRNSLGYEFTGNFTGAIAIVAVALYILYIFPPKHKLWFVMVPNVIWFILTCRQFFIMPYYPEYYDWTNWLSMITEALTCIVGACIVINEYIKERVSSEISCKNTEDITYNNSPQ